MAITINGVRYSGNNISINNNEVRIDGVNVTPKDTLNVNIIVDGNIESIEGAADVKVLGDADSVSTLSGDVEIGGNVNKNVKTMSGDVKVDGHISGNVKTMSGDISSRKIKM